MNIARFVCKNVTFFIMDPVADAARFQGEGLNFRAKLIGCEDVAEARGDKMCQDTIQKLKAIVKASKEHKKRIIVNVSLEGLKILDQVTTNVEHTHEVHRISFISRDMTDSRAFGYIYGPGDGSHKFFGIKTEKAAENLVLSLRDLFQVVYDLKKKEVEEAKRQKEETTITLQDGNIGESDDSVYQVPQNGAPVEGTESEYAVPKNNKPVEEDSGGNLLDLQDQLTSIEKGIEQMNTFDSLFDGLSAPVSSAAPSFNDAWGAPAPAAAGVQSQPFGVAGFGVTAPGTPFPATSTTSPFQPGFTSVPQPGFGSSPAFPSTAPQSGFPAPPLSHPGFMSQAGQPGFSSTPVVGFGVRPVVPFGTPASTAPQFQQPPAFPPPATQTGLPVISDPFANDPFSSGGNNAQTNLFNAPSGNPFGAASGGNVFSPTQAPSNGPVGWPDNSLDILAPTKIGAEAEQEPEPKKQGGDFFGDLCDIGSMAKVKKTPKDMFKEQIEPPKKSLNQLKAEKISAVNPTLGSPAAPTPAFPIQSGAPLQPTASDPFGMLSPAPANNDPFGNVPNVPTTQQASQIPAHDPFGPLGNEAIKIPDLASKSADPFDTSIYHIPSSSHTASSSIKQQSQSEHNHQRPRPKPKKPESILNGDSSQMNNLSVLSDNEFDLPSPEEPPPPLPSDALLNLSKTAPAPPPRPPSNKKLPSPVVVSRSSSIKTSLSVQSNQSGASSSSEDQDNLSSLSPGSTGSSSDTSPVPAIPRRTKLSTSSDTSASPSTTSQNNTPSSVLNSSNHVQNPLTNTSAVQRAPVPKPRKSLSHKSSIGSADGDSKTISERFFPDPFATDPFAPTVSSNDFNCKDHNDNDPFLSSQPIGVQGDFESKWEAFSEFDNKSLTSIGSNLSNKCSNSQEFENNNTPLFGDPF